VSSAGEQSMILGLPMWWAYAMLAPGLALTAVIGLWQGVRRCSGLPAQATGTPAPQAAAEASR
jgi:TRAP-type C4-dicarboxylate transport system permease small subunit